MLIQLLLGLAFLILALLSLTLPGIYILRNLLSLEDELEEYVVSTAFGIVLFTVSAYLLAF